MSYRKLPPRRNVTLRLSDADIEFLDTLAREADRPRQFILYSLLADLRRARAANLPVAVPPASPAPAEVRAGGG